MEEIVKAQDVKLVKGEISPEKWDAARPLIQALYMEENKPFPYVADALRTEHGFFPTKRQFNRKVSEQWGMKKNTSISQRRAVVQWLESKTIDPIQNPVQPTDRSLSRIKIRRWKKELGKGAAPDRHLLSLGRPDITLANKEQEQRSALAEAADQPMVDVFEGSSLKDAHMEYSQAEGEDNEPQTLWDAARIADSPELTYLFAAFHISGIEGSDDDIPPLSLSQSNPSGEEEEEKQFISLEDIMHLQNSKQGLKESVNGPGSDSTALMLCHQKSRTLHQLQPTNPDTLLSLCRVIRNHMSPFSELYPFPNRAGTNRTPQVTLSESRDLHVEHVEYEERLEKLRQTMAYTHPGVICTMERLAKIYRRQGRYLQAEALIRKLISVRKEVCGAGHPETLSACLDLVSISIYQGFYKQAESIHRQVHAAILVTFNAHHKLVARSIITMASILFNLDQDEEAENLERQALQLSLNRHGPQHWETLEVIGYLAATLRVRNQAAASEQLLRIALQLQNHVTGLAETKVCYNICEFAHLLEDREMFDQAVVMYRRAWERSKFALGEKHPEALENMYHLAAGLARQGQLTKSTDMFKVVVPELAEALGDKHPTTLHSMGLFGYYLAHIGSFGQAREYFEKAFTGNSEVYGIENVRTLDVCYWLGYCYENQGLHRDALKLYQDTVKKFETVQGAVQSKVLRLKLEIARLQNHLEAGEETDSDQD